MPQPFQCILYCSLLKEVQTNFIISACGPLIYTFDAYNGNLLSSWPNASKVCESPATEFRSPTEHSGPSTQVLESVVGDVEPQVKRRKLSQVDSSFESASTEILTEGHDTKNHGSRPSSSLPPVVIKLLGSSSGEYVIAVTGENKCIWVFRLSVDGSLKQLSARHMPKRPCSIVLTTDETNILCADKFGDVYALPLLISEADQKGTSSDLNYALTSQKNEASPTEFVPTASSLTVHTKKNQEALKNQQRASSKATKRTMVDFDHQLLLGHVSLLTDLAYITLATGNSDNTHIRSYILTCDRDEHIRVSRGLPQAHVIENYCLGHSDFISKLCVPPWNQKLLISGGGDDHLFVWDWLSGIIIEKIDLRNSVDRWKQEYRSKTVQEDQKTEIGVQDGAIADQKIAVSGIWAVETSSSDDTPEPSNFRLMVTCEGLPALLFYSMDSEGHVESRSIYETKGNVLDATILAGQNTIIYTMDNVHLPLSTKTPRNPEKRSSLPWIGYIDLGKWQSKESVLDGTVGTINECMSGQDANNDLQDGSLAALQELLYGIDNLRKRGQEE